MPTVAIVGVDGAGKTSVAKRLDADGSVRVKYIYMGANIESANVALPTSRLMLWLKLRSFRRRAERAGITDPSYVSTHHEAHRNVRYGAFVSTVRMLNRLAETTYRHVVAAAYRARAITVVYDRHALFESAAGVNKRSRWADRVYFWLMANVYPQPDVTVMLDAPVEMLLERKGEGTLEQLARRRAAYLEQGSKTPGFIRVDASCSFDEVYDEVKRVIESACPGPPAGRRSVVQDAQSELPGRAS